MNRCEVRGWIIITCVCLFPVLVTDARDNRPDGIDLVALNDQSTRQMLRDSGPVVFWLTDTWALVQSGTVPGAVPLLADTGSGAFYLVSTYQTGDDQLIRHLPRRASIRENIYLVMSDPGTMDHMAAQKLDVVRLEKPFSVAHVTDRTAFPDIIYNQAVQDLTARISTEDLLSDLTTLVDFKSRNSYGARCQQAGEWLLERYHELGLFVTTHYHTRYMAPTIIAEKPGTVNPEEIVIICGHYDSINSNKKSTLAPGADDNGTGTAATLQVAKILSDGSFERTIRFIAFSGEEQGLYGSRAYADRVADAGDQIVGVYNFDMIGWVEPYPEDLDCIVNNESQFIVEHFIACANLYTALLTQRVIDSEMVYSDHSPFWNHGYQAMCGIEDSPVIYPYYHSSGDTVDKVDPGFFTEVTRGALAAVAELAILTDNPGSPPAESGLGVDLHMNKSIYHAGDTFRMALSYWNMTSVTHDLPLFIVLDVMGHYWFWPGWTASIDYEIYPMRSWIHTINEPILDFPWPETEGALQSIHFWSALVSEDMSDVMGVYDVEDWGFE
jgi:Peptidase family M28